MQFGFTTKQLLLVDDDENCLFGAVNLENVSKRFDESKSNLINFLIEPSILICFLHERRECCISTNVKIFSRNN